MKRTLVLGQLVQVPVGHRVEVAPLKDDTAYVRDLDTGIEYVPFWLVSRSPDNSYFLPKLYEEQIDATLLARSPRFEGRVTACRVASVAVASYETGFGTRLEVELAG